MTDAVISGPVGRVSEVNMHRASALIEV